MTAPFIVPRWRGESLRVRQLAPGSAHVKVAHSGHIRLPWRVWLGLYVLALVLAAVFVVYPTMSWLGFVDHGQSLHVEMMPPGTDEVPP